MINFDAGHVTLALVCIGLVINCIFERKHALKTEESFIKALLSTSATEYKEALKTPAEQIKQDEAESALAEKAYQLEKLKDPENVQRIKGERLFNVGA